MVRCLTIVTVLLFVSILASDTNNSKKKVQIGIKKRVENCTVKTKKGDMLHMHYRGILENGEEFDSSYANSQPLMFTLGSGQVIKGWDQGLMGMCVGEQRKLVIPPDLGYGKRGAPPRIPPDATLIFHVELVKIESIHEL